MNLLTHYGYAGVAGKGVLAMDSGTVEDLIRTGIPDAVVEVHDVHGDGRHFAATVVSGQFAGLTLIQQHRRVHSALEHVIGNDLHALRLTTRVS